MNQGGVRRGAKDSKSQLRRPLLPPLCSLLLRRPQRGLRAERTGTTPAETRTCARGTRSRSKRLFPRQPI